MKKEKIKVTTTDLIVLYILNTICVAIIRPKIYIHIYLNICIHIKPKIKDKKRKDKSYNYGSNITIY